MKQKNQTDIDQSYLSVSRVRWNTHEVFQESSVYKPMEQCGKQVTKEQETGQWNKQRGDQFIGIHRDVGIPTALQRDNVIIACTHFRLLKERRSSRNKERAPMIWKTPGKTSTVYSASNDWKQERTGSIMCLCLIPTSFFCLFWFIYIDLHITSCHQRLNEWLIE